MTELSLPKLVYDDFYKYVVSLSSGLFVVFVFLASYALNYSASMEEQARTTYRAAYLSYFVLAITALLLFGWGVKKWYARQRMLDEYLSNQLAYQRETLLQKN